MEAKVEEGHAKLFEKHKLVEDLLNSLIISLSDYLIIVVEKLSRYDQEFIQQVCKERSKRSEFKEVFIVHNLRTVTKNEDRDKYFEKLCTLYNGASQPQDGVHVFCTNHIVTQRHVIIMNDSCSDYNNMVFKLINKWTQSIYLQHSLEGKDPMQHFIDKCNLLLNNYIINFGKLEYDSQSQAFFARPSDASKDMKLKIDSSDKVMGISSFVPMVCFVMKRLTYCLV